MQQQIDDSILEKIQKALQFAEGKRQLGSLEEAEVAMMAAQKLLNKYNLEMATVENHVSKKERKITEEKVKFGSVKSDGDWEKNLMSVVCRNNWCTNYWNDYYKTQTVIGAAENIGVVIYLYKFIQSQLKDLSGKAYSDKLISINEQYKLYGGIDYFQKLGGKIKAEQFFCRNKIIAWRKPFVRNWLLGAVQGIDVKLTLERQQAAAANNTMMGLMVVNHDKLQKYLAEEVPDLKTEELNQGNKDKDGFFEGYNTGKGLKIYAAIDEESGERIVQKQIGTIKKRFEGKEVTEEMLKEHVGQKARANCRQYSYQSHGTERDGKVIKTRMGNYLFESVECYDYKNIFWIEFE